MRYVCDAPGGRTWFSMETQAEADAESKLMQHAVARYFAREAEAARRSYIPREGLAPLERDIGLKDHIARTMPVFLTLRDGEGKALATAMLPRKGGRSSAARPVIVGPGNADPWPDQADAIEALARHVGQPLPRALCYPYG